MKMLPKPIVELLDRRILERLDLSRHHRLHDDIPNRNQRSIPASQFFIAVIEAFDRKHVIVPCIDRFEIVYNVCEMKQFAYFEHACPLVCVWHDRSSSAAEA